ncbi:MAG: alanine--tRNA ligase [Chloroflexi bacterium]|nr:MAG: alanine--tRNA ligase [Chloroflexota bacterium]
MRRSWPEGDGWVGRIRTQYNDEAPRPDMTSADIRQRFLNFFKERDHKVLPSSSLIPFGDPTLLFTSAGMVQFKPYFLGQSTPPYPRATTCQKVFRSVDIDIVGHDGHHLTFFEMLGNFSFGDYFKEKAIPYAWEFLTKEVKLERARLWAGIHNDDDESFEIWKKTGIPPERIRRFGDEYNFWAAGPTGPCGPDSEIHYDWGEEYGCGRPDCGPNCEHCDRFLEVWNLVFITWNRDESGVRTPLPKKGIDTGMGLERITSVVNQKRSLFDTDPFQPLIQHFAEEAGKLYGANPETDVSYRVLADHARGTTILLADGVDPANDGRGYVLRRVIRRAMVHARRLGPAVHLSSGVPIVARLLGSVYAEVRNQVDRIADAVRSEEERFGVALRQGLERLQPLLERGTLNPQDVFYLHDTLGFPIELTAELAKERGIELDLEAVAALMQTQRDRSRTATSSFTAPLAGRASRFVGYDRLDADTAVTDVFPVAGEAELADVFLEETPFYAERGGQTADSGWISWNRTQARVIDVQPQGEAIRQRVEIRPDELKPGDRVHAAVDQARRQAIARHHSATHLLHRALRDVLGEAAVQAGSSVQPDYATFDFRFPRALTPEEIDRVSALLNEKIRADLVRRVEELPLDQAIATGAVALFDEKYGERVRVVSFGDWARELCGGTHVERSGEIGIALISSDRSIGAGVRRIEMRAGAAAEHAIRNDERVLRELGDALRAAPPELPARVAALQAEVKRLEKDAANLRQRLAAGGGAQLEEADVDGVRLMLQRVDPDEKDLLVFADEALNRANGNGVAIVIGGRNFAVKVASPLAERLPANDLIQAFRQVAGGKGGGRGPVGHGGGIDPNRIDDAFKSVQDYVRKQLKPPPRPSPASGGGGNQ